MYIRAYLRASTSQQDATRAKKTLKEFVVSYNSKIAAFYIENRSGNTLERPELIRLLDESDPGDILLVESIDRLTRLNDADWDTLSIAIREKGLNIVSLDLPTSHCIFNTFPSDDFMASVMKAINTMLLDLLAASAYKELTERARKQKEGITKAKALGKYKGRQPDLEKHDKILKMSRSKQFSVSDIAGCLGVSVSTVKRVRRQNQ